MQLIWSHSQKYYIIQCIYIDHSIYYVTNNINNDFMVGVPNEGRFIRLIYLLLLSRATESDEFIHVSLYADQMSRYLVST